jgi:transposase
MVIRVFGIDIAKSVFQVHGVDEGGEAVLRKRLTRATFLAEMAAHPPALIGLEAGSGAHHWGRRLFELGHDVRIMPPQYVRPYLKGNKHDAADAEACCEAVQRPGMRFVPLKTEAQQAALMLHREGLLVGGYEAASFAPVTVEAERPVPPPSDPSTSRCRCPRACAAAPPQRWSARCSPRASSRRSTRT